MIDFLRGMVASTTEQMVVVDVAGVAFALLVPEPALYKIHESVEIKTYLHWNPEQGLQLYGFATLQERSAFMLIISCSGIGPKLALAILRQMPVGAFFSAIIAQDTKALSSVSGVGTKKAETLIVHLKDKVAKLVQEGGIQEVAPHAQNFTDLSQALASLHYTRPEIQRALDSLRQNPALEQAPFDELMRKALACLAQARA